MIRYALFFLLLSTITASAQGMMQMNKRVLCMDAGVMSNIMKKEYGEIPYAMGMIENNGFLLILKNPETNSISIIEMSPDNLGCMISSGKDFQILK